MRIPLRGFRAILLKEFTVVFRDPTTLFFMFFPPLIQIVAFGYALDNDVKNMATVVFNEDRTGKPPARGKVCEHADVSSHERGAERRGIVCGHTPREGLRRSANSARFHA
jgi:hypothetical protein